MGSWIYGSIFASLPFIYQDGFILEGFLTSCTFNFIEKNFYTRIIVINMILFGFLIPIISLILFYSLLYIAIRQYNRCRTKNIDQELLKKRRFVKNDASLTTQGLQIVTYGLTDDSKSIKKLSRVFHNNPNRILINNSNEVFPMRAEVKVIKTSIIIVLAFCLSWLPYTIVALVSQFGENRQNIVTPLTLWLATVFAKASAVHNPLIYVFTSKRLRIKLSRYFNLLKRICVNK